jgi:3-methyladenine DNA glycosylase AlkD
VQVDLRDAAASIEKQLRAVGTRRRAEAEKRYLRSDLRFLGVTVPDTRAIVRGFLRALDRPDRAYVVALARELWSEPVHERRFAAVEFLRANVGLLEAEDMELVERLVRESRTWALVDPLATDVAGGLVLRHDRARSTLDGWATDDDFWVRRAALLALMRSLRQGGAFARFSLYADGMLEEKEFFIRKAIGWMLREMSKTRSDEVWKWLAPRAHRASGVTLREAVKYLDEPRRQQVVAAHRKRSPAPDTSPPST